MNTPGPHVLLRIDIWDRIRALPDMPVVRPPCACGVPDHHVPPAANDSAEAP